MPPKNIKSKKGNKRSSGDKMFDITTITPEIHKILTAKQLLKSPEDLVILNVLIAIGKYVEKATIVELSFMYENGFIPLLFNLIPRHKNICRFVLKIITALEEVPGVTEAMSTIDNINILIQTFLLTDDDIIKEFLTYLLKLTCTTEENRQLITNLEMINKLLLTINKSTNPDVHKNSLEVIFQITLCSTASEFAEDMKPELYVCLLENPQEEIQSIAFKILISITQWKIESVLDRLRACRMIQSLFQKLQTAVWSDEHNQALNIIFHFISHPTSGKKEVESLDFLKLLKFASQETTIDSVVLATVTLITEYAKDTFARQVLYEFKIHQMLIKLFNRNCDLLKVKLCEAFLYLAKNICFAQVISNREFIHHLTRLMAQDLPWNPYRQAPIRTIYELLQNTNVIPVLLYKCNTLKQLRYAIIKRNEIDKSVFEMIIEIYEALFLNRSIRKYILTSDTYPNLLELVQDPDMKIAKSAIHILQDSIQLAQCRLWFEQYGGIDITMNLLKDQPNELVHQVTAFLEECVKYRPLGLSFLHAGVIEYLKELPKYKEQTGICRALVNNFFNYDLSMKFYLENYLTYADITYNGFYIHLDKIPNSFLLKDYPIILSPKSTVLTVNFTKADMIQNSIILSPSLGSRKRKRSRPSTRESSVASGSVEDVKELLPPEPAASIFYDFYLHRYLNKAKELIKDEPDLVNKIIILGQFVCKQLSGNHDATKNKPTSIDCKLHYAALKRRLQSNIIPLGLLRFGSFIERALLFKVLADRCNILCELYRRNSIGWCELPLIRPAEECEDSNALTIVYYVIDLMYEIGELMPKNRWDAIAYTQGTSKFQTSIDVIGTRPPVAIVPYNTNEY